MPSPSRGAAAPCRAWGSSAPSRTISCRSPTWCCGPPLRDGNAEAPLLVAEVLSPSTTSLDRGRKIDFYRTVPSLRVLLIVYSDELRVEVWRRGPSDWTVQALGPGGSVALPELDGTVPVSDIYRGLAD